MKTSFCFNRISFKHGATSYLLFASINETTNFPNKNYLSNSKNLLRR